MLQRALSFLWRVSPLTFRRWLGRAAQTRFTVTTGAVVLNERGEVLLLDHVFRTQSGWGIPGGFMNAGEQPEEALRRELREEAGLEVENVQLAFTRSFRRPRQVEIIFRCRARDDPFPNSIEIRGARWFGVNDLPPDLSRDQRRLIGRALGVGANEDE